MSVNLEFYFRHILLYRELVTEDELRLCTAAQDAALEAGEPEPPLTDLLLQQGFLSPSQFQRIQDEISGHIDEMRSNQTGPRVPGYEIEGLESDHTTGRTYRAVQSSLRRKVSIKVLNTKFITERRAVQQYYDEAAAAARAGHPNIVQLIDLGFDPSGALYLIRERVEGNSLAVLLEQQGAFEADAAAALALSVARGLGYISQLGLVHGHLRPSNILVPPDRIAKLQDLGLSRSVPESGATGRKRLLGNPLYMSPEQIRGDNSADHRSDIYSLGAVCFHMLTGRPPFLGANPKAVFDQHLMAKPPVPHRMVGGIPPRLSRFVTRMLAKTPDERYQHADELAADLEDYLLRRARRAAKPAEVSEAPPPARGGSGRSPVKSPSGQSPTGKPLRLVRTGEVDINSVSAAAADESSRVAARELTPPVEDTPPPAEPSSGIPVLPIVVLVISVLVNAALVAWYLGLLPATSATP